MEQASKGISIHKQGNRDGLDQNNHQGRSGMIIEIRT
jgi:hypothetical protein